MERKFQIFKGCLKNRKFRIRNPYLNEVIYDFSFHFVANDNGVSQKINNLYNHSKVMMIDKCEYSNQQYIIICFDKKVVIINEKEISLLNIFFQKNNESNLYILSKNINDKIISSAKQSNLFDDFNFQTDLSSFLYHILTLNRDILSFWQNIQQSIAGYLIKIGYNNSIIHRISNCDELFDNTHDVIDLSEKYFISLHQIGVSQSFVQIIYHIKAEKVFVLKLTNQEGDKLFIRERDKYLKLHHPFLPIYYGDSKYQYHDCIIIEYIEGCELNKIDKKSLPINDKLKILFEIMITFEYIHNNKLIYRDLKPNNIIIDSKGVAILIDFDRMVYECEGYKNDNISALSSSYIAPEIQNCFSFSNKADIYSILLIVQ